MFNEFTLAVWQKILHGDKPYVLFENGTCVVLVNPQENLSEQAKTLLKEWGPVQVGSSAGDFSVIDLDKDHGWLVTSHHPDIFTLILQRDLNEGEPTDESPEELVIGMLGRAYRDEDAKSLNVVHVEARPKI